jgi:hypothetical protein
LNDSRNLFWQDQQLSSLDFFTVSAFILKKFCTVKARRQFFVFRCHLNVFILNESFANTSLHTAAFFASLIAFEVNPNFIKVFLILSFHLVLRWSRHDSLKYRNNHGEPQYIKSQQNCKLTHNTTLTALEIYIFHRCHCCHLNAQ